MSKPIDLGKKLSDSIEIMSMGKNDAHYPDLYISDTDDRRLAEMPDQGEATIKYRVVSRTHREERKGKGNGKDYSCSIRLEILSINPPEGKKKKNGDSDGGLRKAMNGYFKDQS
jgi:hypothetical protein